MKIIFYKCDICKSVYKLHSIENEKIKAYPSTLNCLEGHTEAQNISIILDYMKIEVCPECMLLIKDKVKKLENI